MADRKIISVLRGGQKEEAWLDINERRLTILLTLSNGWSKTYTGVNIYDCFGRIIKEHADLKFLCKGAKRNVRPSSMSAQMTLGVVAYENILGKPASREDLVNIFDYDDQDIVSDPQLQKDYFFLWMESIRDVEE
ncbi:hypothetical protein J2W43_004367 [Pseudomonas brassicacearum]|uniref:Uncharacterized protein n=1 Tax=Pseudomonas brassicacearum TaxID=930166 RepID=A0AAW8MEW4_9PSED|nr:hypothetical protein [Pseudomonas brassicacearum]MDR6960366.1 hypothetical protein [Pseudomonas brassicacearum]